MNDMRISKVDIAIKEAQRFIAKASEAHNRIVDDSMAEISGSKETAAARRASMDLTRALADMRRAN